MPIRIELVVYGCMGTKSLPITVILWLSIAKMNILSEDVLISRSKYLTP